MSTAKKVANRLRQVFPEKSRIAMHIEGLDVAHAHLKIFPFDNDVEFRNRPNMEVEAGHQQLAAIARSSHSENINICRLMLFL